MKEIHNYDVLRSDRCISAHGLEARTPFLDKQFVAVAKAMPPSGFRHDGKDRMEKAILRMAFDENLLPPEVLWRQKEAFSDGVSKMEKSWYQIIQEKIREEKLVPENWCDIVEPQKDEDGCEVYDLTWEPRPWTEEAFYYRDLFNSWFPHTADPWPYWMPRWSPETSDPSARTLAQ